MQRTRRAGGGARGRGRRVGLLLAALLAWACAAPIEPPSRTLDRAELWLGRSLQPPGDGAAWQAVELPDSWELERRNRALEGWYRLPLELPAAPREPYAVFVPRVFPNAAVFVNGVEIGRGGRMSPPIARNTFRPLLFLVPHELWHPGANWIQLRFVTTAGRTGVLHPIAVGPAADLLPAFERARVLGVIVPETSVLLCVVLAASLLLQARGMGDAGRPDRWFAAGFLALAASGVSLVAPDAALPNRLVEWWVGCALNWSVLCFALAVLARREGSRRIARALSLAWLAGTLAYAAAPALLANPVWMAWAAASAGLFGWTLVLLVRDGRRRERWAFTALGAVAAALALLQRYSLSINLEQSSWLIQQTLLPLLFLLGFAAFLQVTLVRAARESEHLARLLDARVAERERELAANYERLRALERENTLAGERARLTRDMHDGAGARLVTALSMLRSGRGRPDDLEEALRDALDDLHLTIDSLAPGTTDLPGALGLLRARLERQLNLHGLRLEWAIGDDGEGRPLSPERLLHVIRIVQESVANALRHSGGSYVRVATGSAGEAGAIWFEIADDGRGGAQPRAGGRGLHNLAQRAALLGGRLELRSDPAGTRVRVHLDPS